MKNKISNIFLLALLIIVVLLIAGIRLRLLHLPLDRDEGEYAYAGWRMLHGGVPYLDFYNMKMPGIYACYSLFFLLFGVSVAAIRLGLLLINIGNAALMFLLGKQLGGVRSGIYSAVIYLLFSFTVKFHSFSTNAEYFAVFFVLAGMIFLVKGEKPFFTFHFSFFTLFLSGFLLGISVLMKQPSIVFAFMAMLLLIIEAVRQKIKFRNFFNFIFVFSAGVLSPILITVIILYHFGAGHNFLYFTFDYARQYISYLGWQDGFNNCMIVLNAAIESNKLMWAFLPVSFLFLLFNRNAPESRFNIILFVFSFVAVTPGFYFRPHYFQYLTPAISLLEASALVSLESFLHTKYHERSRLLNGLKYLPEWFLAIAAFYFFFNQRNYFFSMKEEKFHSNLFNSASKAGDFISQHSNPESKVAIFGAEPEIWFYAKRKAASGYLYVYPFLENQKFAGDMLQQFYSEIINSKPDILVYTSNSGTWFASEPVHNKIYNWYEAYRDSSFKRIGFIDLVNDSVVNYCWTADTAVHPVNKDDYIEIDERTETNKY